MPRFHITLIAGPKDSYGNAFAAIAICPCGHEAQLPHEWVKCAAYTTQQRLTACARLKCSRCGGRGPKVEVYNVRA